MAEPGFNLWNCTDWPISSQQQSVITENLKCGKSELWCALNIKYIPDFRDCTLWCIWEMLCCEIRLKTLFQPQSLPRSSSKSYWGYSVETGEDWVKGTWVGGGVSLRGGGTLKRRNALHFLKMPMAFWDLQNKPVLVERCVVVDYYLPQITQPDLPKG